MRERAIDRWIYVATAVGFILVALTGFLPDSAHKIALVEAGKRAPFPLVLHVHAVLMGSFLLLLLAQTVLAATGRIARHMQLGVAGMALGTALVVVGFVLAPTMYHLTWSAAQAATGPARADLMQAVSRAENILLIQIRSGLVFALLLLIGLRARVSDPGVHKRLVILAVAPALGAGLARITWLPSTLPASAVSQDVGVLLLVTPMIVWDLIRNRRVHPAYLIALAVMAPFTIAVHLLWNTPWWHATARTIMGV